MKRSLSYLALAAVLLAASAFTFPASAADAAVVAAQTASAQSAPGGVTIAHVRLPGVYYGAQEGSTKNERPTAFDSWVVTPSTPVPAGATVIRVIKTGDDFKPGLQDWPSATEHGVIYRGGPSN
jgi:hypothetical protein